MAEEAKNIRRTAKSRFTRKRNELFKSIDANQELEMVEGNYLRLTEAWDIVEGKHDLYTMYLTDEELEVAENWITELQDLFAEATARKIQYIRKLTEAKNNAREDAIRQETDRKKREEITRMTENALIKRDTAQAVFDTLYGSTLLALEADVVPASTVDRLIKQIEDAFTDCKQANSKVLDLADRDAASTAIKWASAIQCRFNEITEKISLHTATEDKKTARDSSAPFNLQLEKIKMPRFEGEIRTYPQFRRDFEKQVVPHLRSDDIPYVLRSCLGNEPAKAVKSIDDDVTEMWKRLDEKYGDPAKVADVIIDGIRRTRMIREGEEKRFIEFVETVEDGYRDLKRLGMEAEITTTSSVSIIEKKLPSDVRRKWAERVSAENSTVDKSNKFPSLLKFLQNQRSAMEYDSASLRATATPWSSPPPKAIHHTVAKEENDLNSQRAALPKCLIHENGKHSTEDCKVYMSKTLEEKMALLKDKGACWSCLKGGHRARACRAKKPCGINECPLKHHQSLHEVNQLSTTPANEASASGPANVCNMDVDACLLQVQNIKTRKGSVNVMWDNAASLCFITNAKAKEEKLKGTKVDLSIIKIGAQDERINTNKYILPLVDTRGQIVLIEAYGIDKITSDIKKVNTDNVAHLFKGVSKDEITRPAGTIDVLIGAEYAAYHPVRVQSAGHLLLLKNRFGLCIGGTHPSIKGAIKKHDLRHARVQHVIKVDDFYNVENLGVECNPRCGNCKCGKCAIGSKDYSIKEEKELALIERNMSYDEQDSCWVAKYPWIKDPSDLPDNRKVALALLITTERRLVRNPIHATVYDDQVKDMVDRGVARKLSKDELANYKGPIHYISHHEVLKPDSKSTPVRIVFNSSANYMGHVLNQYWAKGPDLLNNLLGILVRFRENETALMGDIKKMYHTVKTTTLDQHTHRFLWRDMDAKREADTYVIQRVSFGDKPSATIATMALRKTAEMGNEEYPEAAKIILNNTYMDDIIDSTNDLLSAKKLTKDIENLVGRGGFKLKEWIFSHSAKLDETPVPNETNVSIEKVLGIMWDPVHDQLCFKAKLNLCPKRKKKKRSAQNATKEKEDQSVPPQLLTKRMILSQINSMYDPLGLAGPFTVRAKILMRRLWASDEKLDWDDPIPEETKQHWLTFFDDLTEMNNVRFERCMRPPDAVGDPVLIIFSDASNEAYGSCAYARWKQRSGGFASSLIVSKNRLAPLKRISIDKIELCGAILNKRLKSFIDKECRYSFQRCYHIVDSQIVHAMIQKNSYGFNTFAATRIGEIQEGTNVEDWYWVESEYNIADWITRGKKPDEIGLNSNWQEGPSFLKQPEKEWPITRNYLEQHIPQQLKVINTISVSVEDNLASRIKIERFSDFNRLLRVTARVLKLFHRSPKVTLKNATAELSSKDIELAETFWIKEAQRMMEKDIKDGKYKRLCPRRRTDGIYVISGRSVNWVEMSYNKEDVILLPYKHRFSRLYSEHVHAQGHHGILSTASKVRSKFWIIKLLKLLKSIKLNCVTCKRLDKKLSEQVMGNLPEERLKPAPPWYSTSIDLFGPYTIRDEVKKRTTSKAYGVIFNCLATRAVYLDLAPDYSTEKFLMVLRRFVSLRGYPCNIYSDNGPQLVAANQELQRATKSWDWEKLKDFGVMEGFQWNFTPADAPWQNGTSESLIKSVKRALTAAIGESILTFSELQTVFFEVANLINERPIGRQPTSPEDGSYLCPNDLLLGRSTARVPSGPFKETVNPKHRFEFIQRIIDGFWKKWTTLHFPNLIVRQKWHTAHRNLKSGDVVMIQDSNLIRGQWRLGIVSNTFPSADGKVRRVEVRYKNARPGEAVTKYEGRGYVTVERPVHRLVVLLPKGEDNLNST